MQMHCHICHGCDDRLACTFCLGDMVGPLREKMDVLLGLIRSAEGRVQDQFGVYNESLILTGRVAILEDSIAVSRARVNFLSSVVAQKRADQARRLELIAHQREQHEQRKKRQSVSKSEYSEISFEVYLKDSGKYDKVFSSLHPFRKLKSLAHSVYEERRIICHKLLSTFRFRLINSTHQMESPVHGPLGGSTTSLTHYGPNTELVGDFYGIEGKKDQAHVLIWFVIPLLILFCKVVDYNVPFPLMFGSMSSSCTTKIPSVNNQRWCPSVRQVHKDIQAPLDFFNSSENNDTGVGSPQEYPSILSSLALNLLNEDLRYICSVANNVPLCLIPSNVETMSLLSSIFTSPNLGRIFSSLTGGTLVSAFSHSPTLSAGSSPGAPGVLLSASSYRKASVFEQSLTEGGEWTLLDQL